MTSEYTGFEIGGYDEDASTTNDNDYQFGHTRIIKHSFIPKSNNINRRKMGPVEDVKDDTAMAIDGKPFNIDKTEDTQQPDSKSKQSLSPLTILKKIVGGVERLYEKIEPQFIDHIPKEITQMADMIEGDMLNFEKKYPGWVSENENLKFFIEREMDYKGFSEHTPMLKQLDDLGMRIFTNHETKELRIVFQGFNPEAGVNSGKHVKNILNPLKDAVKEFSQSYIADESKSFIEFFKNKYPEYELVFNGHSWGAFQAKYWATEYKTTSHLFNAHIMPWNRFKQMGRHFFHTTISDYTDFKHLYPAISKDTHFYYPASKNAWTRATEKIGETSNEIARKIYYMTDGHYMQQFMNPQEESIFSKYFYKNLTKTGILKTLGIGMTALDTYFALKKDFNNDNPIGEKIADSTIDVANKTQEFILGNALFDSIFASTVALAPETGGISLVAGVVALGGVLVYTGLSEGVVPIVKKGVVYEANELKKSADVIGKAVETGKDVNGDSIKSKIGSSIKKKNEYWKRKARSVKHFFHW